MSIPCSDSALCQRVRSNAQGGTHCQRYLEGLVKDAQADDFSANPCDAGLAGFCVPLRFAGETLGYLMAGGYRVGEIDAFSRNRLRHLLDRLHVDDVDEALYEFEHHTVSMTEAKDIALQRWLKLAAESLIRSLELKGDDTERPLPTFIVKICSLIQREYEHPPSLVEAAEICGLSEGYFCRAFHGFTGLRYVEYIHAVRIEHVCDLLMDPKISITEAAFAVGFQSLSQFNRVFRKLKGMSPRQWRSEQVSARRPALRASA